MEWKTQPTESTQQIHATIDALPNCVLVLGADLSISYANTAARHDFNMQSSDKDSGFLGDAIECIHASETASGCGGSKFCENCVVRHAVSDALNGQGAFRRHAVMKLHYGSDVQDVHFLVTASMVKDFSRDLALLTLEDVSEISKLRELLPVGGSCKAFREDPEYYLQVEEYFRQRPALDFSHGLCPQCKDHLKPDKTN